MVIEVAAQEGRPLSMRRPNTVPAKTTAICLLMMGIPQPWIAITRPQRRTQPRQRLTVFAVGFTDRMRNITGGSRESAPVIIHYGRCRGNAFRYDSTIPIGFLKDLERLFATGGQPEMVGHTPGSRERQTVTSGQPIGLL